MAQVNRYGLDFLRREHVLDEVGSNQNPRRTGSAKNDSSDDDDGDRVDDIDTEALAASVANKPDLEKQFDVIHFLQAHRSAGWMPPSVIYQRTGIDLEENVNVAQMLKRNPKIKVEIIPDPENPSLTIDTYAYQAKYNNVRDRKSLLAQINRCKNGVPMRDMIDSYDNVMDDLDALITAGDVLALFNTEDKDKVLFPRGEPFFVELDGIINPPPKKKKKSTDTTMNNTEMGSLMTSQEKKMYCVETDSDPRSQVRRGEAIQIGGSWFRVSSAVKEGPLKDQPARATAPLSVVSRKDLSKRNEIDGYIRPFSERIVPADAALPPSAIENLKKAKEARERLLKLAHGGRAGGAASQLLGVNAHSSNPVALAASLGTSHATGSRRRPKVHGGGGSSAASNASMRAAAQETMVKLKEAALDPYLSLYSHVRRHGCTKDVREMYLKTRGKVPEAGADLKAALIEHKLLEPDEEMRRARLKKRANVDNDGKPKKRRYYERKNQRMTNTHLEGTEIGAVLRRATEKQQQGQAVGDGGM
ncbi:hypothetical protein FRACYDRAFT_174399 [Fragilariopsis cylindrus CCMP1102]|uniref:TFA2 Winged helix domain-containing protein n=1 Tax=Fragilariopsis cylindrus CCMP1102 TaxID=635003 RepID=A0A1E7EPK7_9STRA|nr:hypothetical protein FRACYDRAFT_174399 [Fragilariopsis cylindrus CCMP1102]|eukprot:OEU07861.1 hypothetical protein FRACYDRAFT_174399 [Fragilariopsis cylindrus CCMP1102]